MHSGPDLSVFSHYDFRTFLGLWWEQRRARDPSFTKSEVSRRLGLPNTRSYFNDVLTGKKVTENFVERFLELLQLDEPQARYFRALVHFNQTDDLAGREAAFERLVSLHREQARDTNPRQAEFHRAWWNGALLALLSQTPMGSDWEAMAQALRPTISANAAQAAVMLLESLGLLYCDPEGLWRTPPSTDAVELQLRNTFVLHLQRQQMELSRRILNQQMDSPREFSSAMFKVTPEGLELLQDRIDQFRREMRTLAAASASGDGTKVVLCLGFFPVQSLD